MSSDLGIAPPAESTSDPFGGKYLGFNDGVVGNTSELDAFDRAPGSEIINDPVVDTDGNSLTDVDDAFNLDKFKNNSTFDPIFFSPTITIIKPRSRTFYSDVIGGEMPTIDTEARLIGIAEGEWQRTDFIWEVHFSSPDRRASRTFSLTSRGPKVRIDLGNMGLVAEGHGTIKAIANYRGRDISSDSVSFTVKSG